MSAKKYFTEEDRRQANAEKTRQYRLRHPDRARRSQAICLAKIKNDPARLEKLRARNRAYYHRNKIACIQRAQEYYRRNEDQKKAYAKDYYRQNTDRIKDQERMWRAKNRALSNAIKSRWNKKHPGLVNSLNAKRRAIKLMATPKWVSQKDILPFYEMAAAMTSKTGIEHAVDHVWPIQGKTFTGLHVPWNLQVITASENSRKGNSRPCQP